MIRYFWEGLCPSVRVKMEQRGQELDNFKELIEKAVDAEAKAALRPVPMLAKPINTTFGEAGRQ